MAREDEDELPRPKLVVTRNLERMSIDELNDYIAELEAEIARARADIKKKQSVMAAGDAFFRKR
ncbi:MAG TPA: DUF1192 domain-containing protein [Alphaproteobacteria bacterium]